MKKFISLLVLGLAIHATAVFANEYVSADELVSAEEIQLQYSDEEEAGFEAFAAGQRVRRIACYATNQQGFQFEAIGTHSPTVQDAALRLCYRFPSARCWAQGCRVVYLRSGD